MTDAASRRETSREILIDGALNVWPIVPAVAPFGMVFGAIAVEKGMAPLEAALMSLLVFAGASQLAALQMMSEGAPYIVAVGTAIIINLRMAMYSASLAPYWQGTSRATRAAASALIQDQSYAIAIARYRQRDWGPRRRLLFFAGNAAALYVVWQLATWAGIAFGGLVPETLDMDYFVVLVFISLIGPMLRTGPEWAAMAVALLIAVLAREVPYRAGLFLAAAGGITTGLVLEQVFGRPDEAPE